MEAKDLDRYIMELGSRLADIEMQAAEHSREIGDLHAMTTVLDNRGDVLIRQAKEQEGLLSVITEHIARIGSTFDMMSNMWRGFKKEKTDE